jgi:hypothetical protein
MNQSARFFQRPSRALYALVFPELTGKTVKMAVFRILDRPEKDAFSPAKQSYDEQNRYKLSAVCSGYPGGRQQFEAKKMAFRMFLKIGEFTTGYPSQNTLPVAPVKKNPLKRLFSTEAGEEKRGYPPP